jgi:hypothetical protein
VWAAVGLSLALMAPSMAANINPPAAPFREAEPGKKSYLPGSGTLHLTAAVILL